jgi:hypothetical protein
MIKLALRENATVINSRNQNPNYIHDIDIVREKIAIIRHIAIALNIQDKVEKLS